jgi:hypothetical protein
VPTINPAATNKRTALVLLNTALAELGMPSISSINSTDDTAVQLLALANGLGSRVAQLPFWAELVETFTITTVEDQDTYDLPLDWGVPVVGTTWDRSTRWPLIGPTPPIQWQTLQSGFGLAAPQYRYRFVGLQIIFYPSNVAGDHTVVHEYLSTGWALGLSGATATVRKPRITADTDYVLFSEEMFICGVKVAWLMAKGLESTNALIEFGRMLEAGWANSSSAPVINFVPNPGNFFITLANVPDTGYGS